MSRAERLAAEIAHGRLLRERYPSIWSWSTPAGDRRALRRAKLMVAAGGFRSGQHLIDLGCGTGVFTERVARLSGARVQGVDVSPDLVDEARRRLPEFEFAVADAHALPFPEGHFDGVFGSSTLHHLELEAALAEILRVLKSGGRMVFAEPNILNPQVFVQKSVPAIKRRVLEVAHETAFVRGALASRVRRAGFIEVRCAPFDFLHPLTPVRWIGAVEGLGLVIERTPLLRELAGSTLLSARKPARAGSVSRPDSATSA
ncbi:MAG: class I SAM-dependent methyltransferase [Candidatus Eisenbacteria bacterium]